MKNKYQSSIICFSNKNNIKVKREILLKWINECWYDNNIIKKEIIINFIFIHNCKYNVLFLLLFSSLDKDS